MASIPNPDSEVADATRIDEALAALEKGDIATCEPLLRDVASRTPASYQNEHEREDGSLEIKFWDQSAFLHYVMWMKKAGRERSVEWTGNAYPRAYYYLGFLSVKQREYDRALDYLDRGWKLEPTNPKFLLEKGQAYVRSARYEDALAVYGRVSEVGLYVSPRDVAVGLRGRGFVLIETGDLDGAEQAFLSSLEFDRDSSVARNELDYIAHLRAGGGKAAAEIVATRSEAVLNVCAACGSEFDEGILIDFQGVPTPICKGCQRRLTKKWWQFWK